MPRESHSIALPAALLDAIDADIDPAERDRFVSRAVAAALLQRRLRDAGGDAGLEPWWPMDDLDFVVLRNGEFWLTAEEE